MKLSAEVTLYPFQESYLPPIKTTITHLGSFEGVEIQTFPTASILYGDYDKVMDAIKETVAWSYREFGRCVFLVKYLPDYNAFDKSE